MTRLVFGKQAYKRNLANGPEQKLVNFIVERDGSDSEDEEFLLLTRPGLDRFSTLPSAIQCILSTDGALAGTYVVSDNALYSVAASQQTVLGRLSGFSDTVSMAASYDRLAIVQSPLVALYGATETSTTPSFRALVLPDVADGRSNHAVGVTSLNGYLVIACSDGTFFWLVPGRDTIDPLHFATAESSPDGLTGIATLNGNLVLLGARTIEMWQTTGNADQPFQRLAGQDFQRGCMARDTIARLDNSLFWTGDDCKVYRASSVPIRISTETIEERIRLRSAPPSAWSFDQDGHLFYVLTIPEQGTFAYDVATKLWSEFQSPNRSYWRPQTGTATEFGTLVGDSETGALWLLSDDATDDGAAIERRATATIAIKGKPARVNNILIEVGSGAACQWRLRWADGAEPLDGQPWLPLAAVGGPEHLSAYRLGHARAPFRTFEIAIFDPVSARLSGARVGEAWR